jgi:hypothetical protein
MRVGLRLVILAVYVDDMLALSNHKPQMESLKRALASEFEIKDLGPVDYYLGIEVSRNRRNKTLSLSQGSYIERVAERFSLQDARAVATPMEVGAPRLSLGMGPQNDAERARMGSVPYASAVGSLMYAAVSTRVDMAFVVGQLSRFSGSPGREHWEAAKRAVVYLKSTKDGALSYSGDEGTTLVGYCDSDFAMCPDTSKSTTGWVLLLAGGAVAWKSKKQPVVAQSTAEAEYVAASDACMQIVWAREFLAEVGFEQKEPTVLFVDNQSTIELTKDPVFHDRTKHIKRRFHFIRQCVEERSVRVLHISTKDNISDLLTKPLARDRHTLLNGRAGLQLGTRSGSVAIQGRGARGDATAAPVARRATTQVVVED